MLQGSYQEPEVWMKNEIFPSVFTVYPVIQDRYFQSDRKDNLHSIEENQVSDLTCQKKVSVLVEVISKLMQL